MDFIDLSILNSFYIKLRTRAYYDNTLFFLKKNIILFEKEKEDRLFKLYILVNKYIKTKDCSIFDCYLSQSLIRPYPKDVSIKKDISSNDEEFINESYIDSCLLVFDAPVEIYILDLIATTYLLKLDDFFLKPELRDSYTYRIDDSLLTKNRKIRPYSKTIFKNYSCGYSSWYKNAFKEINKQVANGKKLIIFKGDFEKFYFKNSLCFSESQLDKIPYLDLICHIFKHYSHKLKMFANINGDCFAPVGFLSSVLLMETIGSKYDKKICKSNEYFYYGRYADDFIIVYEYNDLYGEDFSRYLNNSFVYNKLNIKKVSKSIVKSKEDIDIALYKMKAASTSCVDFITNPSSIEFRLDQIPTMDFLDSFSIPSVFKLKRFLKDEIACLKLTGLESNENENFVNLLKILFSGKECLKYFKLWFDLFQYLYLKNDTELFNNIANQIEESIGSISSDFQSDFYKVSGDSIKKQFYEILNISKNSVEFIETSKISNEATDEEKFSYLRSLPYIVSPAEIMTYFPFENFDSVLRIYRQVNGFSKKVVHYFLKKENNYNIIYFSKKTKERHLSKPKIGLIMNNHKEVDVIKTIKINDHLSNGKNLGNLIKIFREARSYNLDYIIGPECYIPYSWIGIVSYLCDKYSVTLICGLQFTKVPKKSIVINNVAVFKKFSSSGLSYVLPIIREKNYYSPHEDLYMASNGFMPRVNDNKTIYFIKDDFMIYSVLLCYEITYLSQRAIFNKNVDCLFVPVFNRDTNYFDAIVTSFSRDAYCYIVESNSSQYFGSSLIGPFKSEAKTIASGKGGMNVRLIATEIDVKYLRRIKKTYYKVLENMVGVCLKCTLSCKYNYNECSKLKFFDLWKWKAPTR